MEEPLRLVGTEQKLGGYRIDILAQTRVDGRDRYVVIENQLERTDADHLGRLISCAAEVDASHAVWVGTEFRDEHLKVIDALGKSDAGCAFHALKLDATWTDAGRAHIDLVTPKSYSSPDDKVREVLHSCMRASQKVHLTMRRVQQLADEYPDMDFTRYRYLIEEAGWSSYWADKRIDQILDAMPEERRTRGA